MRWTRNVQMERLRFFSSMSAVPEPAHRNLARFWDRFNRAGRADRCRSPVEQGHGLRSPNHSCVLLHINSFIILVDIVGRGRLFGPVSRVSRSCNNDHHNYPTLYICVHVDICCLLLLFSSPPFNTRSHCEKTRTNRYIIRRTKHPREGKAD